MFLISLLLIGLVVIVVNSDNERDLLKNEQSSLVSIRVVDR